MTTDDGKTEEGKFEFTEYILVDNGFLEPRIRHITQQEYTDQNKR